MRMTTPTTLKCNKVKAGKEQIIKDALSRKGYRVNDVWFIGLCGWYCEIETGVDEPDPVEYFLGRNAEQALANITNNNLEEL